MDGDPGMAARTTRMRRALGAGLLGALAISTTMTNSASAEGQPAEPQPASLDAPVNGAAAIADLGPQLAGVAAAAGLAPGALKGELLHDDDLWVDTTGRLFYVESEFDELPPAAGGAPVAEAAPFPYGSTFSLHSRPGSDKVIYLDFDGQTVNGTNWNSSYTSGASFDAAPFDADGTPGTFANSERDVIQSVWQRVAEDFAPFDIDVTTEDPGQDAITRADSGDTEFGTRLLITDTSTIYSVCSCGGIAYLSVFGTASSHASYQPAFVFSKDNHSAKFIAEAASHEIGHNLGLTHDGVAGGAGYYTGHANWAPIMGVGYYKPVSQWSKGEYAKANNKQDDFVVIQANGAALIADDFGDTAATAEFLGASYPTEETGLITTAVDVDYFKVNLGAGSATITASAAPNSANLDLSLELINSKGKAVAKAAPTSTMTTAEIADGLDAEITATVTAGTYLIKIAGVGNGSKTAGYSDYGSVGAYTLDIDGQSGAGFDQHRPDGEDRHRGDDDRRARAGTVRQHRLGRRRRRDRVDGLELGRRHGGGQRSNGDAHLHHRWGVHGDDDGHRQFGRNRSQDDQDQGRPGDDVGVGGHLQGRRQRQVHDLGGGQDRRCRRRSDRRRNGHGGLAGGDEEVVRQRQDGVRRHGHDQGTNGPRRHGAHRYGDQGDEDGHRLQRGDRDRGHRLDHAVGATPERRPTACW